MDAKRKLERLFESARNEFVPQPGDDFMSGVMRAIHRESPIGSISMLDQLASFFPRLAMASALMIMLCVAADYCLANFVQRDVSTSAAELSEQWMFAIK